MFITGLGSAVPERRYTQTECWEYAKSCEQIRRLSSRSQALVRKVLLGDNGIESRHLALADLSEIFETGPDVLHCRFATHAPALATKAARLALQDAGCDAPAVDTLIVST